MAGTLTISTLSDGTNSTSATNCIQGSAKAWVNFNGVTTVTIRSSYNVSSITRTSSGYYTVTMTNALSDANYTYMAMSSSIGNLGVASTLNQNSSYAEVAPTSTSFSFLTGGGGVNFIDGKYVYVAVYR